MAVSAREPWGVFLLDALGAIASALILGVVLPRFVDIFGLPPGPLTTLGWIAGFYAAFSLLVFLLRPRGWRALLGLLPLANLIFLLATVTVAAFHWPQVRPLGWAYVAGDALVVLLVVSVERRALTRGKGV